jgi:hypothetical protein
VAHGTKVPRATRELPAGWRGRRRGKIFIFFHGTGTLFLSCLASGFGFSLLAGGLFLSCLTLAFLLGFDVRQVSLVVVSVRLVVAFVAVLPDVVDVRIVLDIFVLDLAVGDFRGKSRRHHVAAASHDPHDRTVREDDLDRGPITSDAGGVVGRDGVLGVTRVVPVGRRLTRRDRGGGEEHAELLDEVRSFLSRTPLRVHQSRGVNLFLEEVPDRASQLLRFHADPVEPDARGLDGVIRGHRGADLDDAILEPVVVLELLRLLHLPRAALGVASGDDAGVVGALVRALHEGVDLDLDGVDVVLHAHLSGRADHIVIVELPLGSLQIRLRGLQLRHDIRAVDIRSIEARSRLRAAGGEEGNPEERRKGESRDLEL